MARCPYCEYPLSDDRERLGARCPSCHDPLYEPPTRKARPARPDEPTCAAHPAMESVGPCARCGRHVCETCRTRWRGVVLCIACVQKAIDGAEATPAMARAGRAQAQAAVAFSAAGWLLAAAGAGLLYLARGSAGDAAPVLTLSALVAAGLGAVPAALGVGQAAAALRGQTEQERLAWAGLGLGGAYVGLALGLGAMGLWQ
ncbi:MAG: hypothetical protein ACRC33_15620 [Gemmataceae bacterium]